MPLKMTLEPFLNTTVIGDLERSTLDMLRLNSHLSSVAMPMSSSISRNSEKHDSYIVSNTSRTTKQVLFSSMSFRISFSTTWYDLPEP